MSNFKGYLIKTPHGVFPNTFIMHKGYEQIPNQIMDLDTKRNGKGLLIRHVLPYRATTIKFTTVPMTLTKKIEFQKHFPNREKIHLEYWNEETNSYRTSTFYLPDITYKQYGFRNGEPFYLSVNVELIGYGEKI